MLIANKIELRPTPEQADYLNRACGARRHCDNQLLHYFSQDGVKWSKAAAYPYYIQVLRVQFSWYAEVSSRVTRNAIDDLDNAFKHFFRRVKAKANKPGYPRFKKKDLHDSFALRESGKCDVDGRTLRIEKLKTRIKMRQGLRFTGQTKQVTISKRAGRFYASILVDTDEYNPHAPEHASVGVDLGIKDLATLSTGEVIPANQRLKKHLKYLKRRQRNLSRKVKGSRRSAKAKLSVARLHQRISHQRKAVLHELSDKLTRTYQVITLEDLNVSGMIKNHCLARAIADAGFGELRRQIEYKAAWRGVTVIFANRFYPSSKTCHACGKIHDMPLNQRTMACDCGHVMDRDLNAAKNLDRYGLDRLDALRPDVKRTQEPSQTASAAWVLTA
ncbi:RNA-guided endonuclease InsQ/TnpB family protein [Thiorhodospira sibirica]|uniref:RNA-guided endonuclease InsQ/TnpB family protein n=1 Tax=Thiorhodospira sibirica TaxID=154347 RepID=UPI001C8D8D48|nr:RNA-guided endonuclease TnpB family protein [Thiorhodospira sibirica]